MCVCVLRYICLLQHQECLLSRNNCIKINYVNVSERYDKLNRRVVYDTYIIANIYIYYMTCLYPFYKFMLCPMYKCCMVIAANGEMLANKCHNYL